jgi:hypothetical protein
MPDQTCVLRAVYEVAGDDAGRNVTHKQIWALLPPGDRNRLSAWLHTLFATDLLGQGDKNVNLTPTGLALGKASLDQIGIPGGMTPRWDEVLAEIYRHARQRGNGNAARGGEIDTSPLPGQLGLILLPTFQAILGELETHGFVTRIVGHPEMVELTQRGSEAGEGLLL